MIGTVGKTKVKENSYPRNLTIGETDITEKSLTAQNLNDFFVNIVPKFASVIPNVSHLFGETNTVLNGTELT